MNTAPIMKVTMNHERSFFTSPRSAANTPIWQVKEESTRTVVFTEANGTFSALACSDQKSAPVTERSVKYIAKRAAKNISSELSQMMVPTLVRFGRLTVGCACPVSTAVAVATSDIMSVPYLALTPGVPFGVSRSRRCPPVGGGRSPERANPSGKGAGGSSIRDSLRTRSRGRGRERGYEEEPDAGDRHGAGLQRRRQHPG